MTIEEERAHLAMADDNIADAEARIKHQRAIVAELEEHGHSSAAAQSVLQTMIEALAVMEDHRQLIKRELERLRQQSA